jgi:acyl phosphate:glycerol-3-phosphate acyltransferase
MSLMTICSLILAAYLLGSIPTSYLFGRSRGIDLRQHGSRNIGATNALRVLGTKIGIITMIIDIAKGFFAVYVSKLILPEIPVLYLIFIGLAAVIGHIFTIFLKFKGGKGVATSAGVFLALAPAASLIAVAVFIITVAMSKYVSLGSILAAAALFIYELVINLSNSFQNYEILIFTSVIFMFILIKHRSNINRILKGEENKLNFRGKK